MIPLIAPLASAAILALAALPSSAHAETCASYVSLFTGPACHGTGVNTLVSFNHYGDENPTFESTVDLLGTGSSESTSLYYPNTFSPYREVSGHAGTAIRGSLLGSFRGETADTFAAATLGTGGLKVTAGTSALPPDPQTTQLNNQYSSASLRDQISVIFPKAFDTIQITLNMAVTGTITPSPEYGIAGIPRVQAEFQALDGQGQELGYAGRNWETPGTVSDTLTDTFVLVGQVDLGDRWQTTFDLRASLFTSNVVPGSRIDFGNSAYLDIRLPDTAAFTSASGEFLTTPVPEPTTSVLMALGLATLLWRMAGRRHRVASADAPQGA